MIWLLLYVIPLILALAILGYDLSKKEKSSLFHKWNDVVCWFTIAIIPFFNMVFVYVAISVAVGPILEKRIWK